MRFLLNLILPLAMPVMLLAGGGGTCTPDPNNSAFFNPSPDTMPCIQRGIYYDQVIQIYLPDQIDLATLFPNIPFPVTVTIDSIVITNVSGLPAGINYTLNPSNGIIHGGENACVLLTGTTNAPAGRYDVDLDGTVSVSDLPIFPGVNENPDTTLTIDFIQSVNPTSFNLFVDVIEAGAPCRVSNLNDISSIASLRTFPNPSSGIVHVTWNGCRQSGDLHLINTFGEVVMQYPQRSHYQTEVISTAGLPSGVYNLVLPTTKGALSQRILVP
ncbi:MAG: T9SS type A sorting domain-containing protein [Chitinophagales bacterium]|nr:T9SS type A sorting domain-containing protein [Chitinophagales bacterium]